MIFENIREGLVELCCNYNYRYYNEIVVSMFPTCVGMNRNLVVWYQDKCNVPHMRGDEPLLRSAGLQQV